MGFNAENQKKGPRARRFRFFAGLAYFAAGAVCYPVLLALCRCVSWIVRTCPGGEILELPGDIFRFAAGAVLFCVAYVSVWRPSKLYVLGHELTHVIFGLMCGSKVSKFKVKKEEGSVVLSRPWMVPSLAPYFFPIYSVLALALYGAASWAAGGLPLWLDGLFVAAVGFFWGFHVCFTVNGLLQKQNDVEPFGFFFSYMFILTMNAAVLAVELTAVSQVDFSELSAVFGEMFSSAVSALWSLKAG